MEQQSYHLTWDVITDRCPNYMGDCISNYEMAEITMGSISFKLEPN